MLGFLAVFMAKGWHRRSHGNGRDCFGVCRWLDGYSEDAGHACLGWMLYHWNVFGSHGCGSTRDRLEPVLPRRSFPSERGKSDPFSSEGTDAVRIVRVPKRNPWTRPLPRGGLGGGKEDVWGRDGIGLTSNPRGFSFPPSDLSETSPKRHVVVRSTNPRKTKSRILIFLRRERIGKVQPKTSEKKRGT